MTVMMLAALHFDLPANVLVLGVVLGMSYALLGLAVTLTYRSARVLNFAVGELGAIAAALLGLFVLQYKLSYWIALPIALAASGLAGVLIERFLVRHLTTASRTILQVATIAGGQAVYAVSLFLPRIQEGARKLYPLPFRSILRIGSVRTGPGEVVIVMTVPVVAVALAAFLARSRVGLASRAVADNVEATTLLGVPVSTVSAVVWGLSGCLAGLAGILVAGTRPVATIGLQADVGPTLLIPALAAAVLGGLTRLSAVFAGGLAIGLLQVLLRWNYPTSGVADLAVFLVILGSLLGRGRRMISDRQQDTAWSLSPGRLAAVRRRPSSSGAAVPTRSPRRALIAVAVAAVCAPVVLGTGDQLRLASVAVFAVVLVSLVILTGWANQPSFGQFAFVAVGALVSGRLAQLGYPGWITCLYTVAAGGLVAFLVGLAAIRIRGVFLAIATLGLAVVSSGWLFTQSWLVKVKGLQNSLAVKRPKLLGVDFSRERNFYWACLVLLAGVLVIARRLRNSGWGRRLLAVGVNEVAASTLGISPRRTKLTAFVLSGMVATFGGYLYALLLVHFSDTSIFAPQQSIFVLSVAVVGGIGYLSGAVAGAMFSYGLPLFIGSMLGLVLGPKVEAVISAAGLVWVITRVPGGLVGQFLDAREKRRVRREQEAGLPTEQPIPPEAGQARGTSVDGVVWKHGPGAPTRALDIEGLEVAFGGNHVLNGATLHVAPGEIVGIIGPNGAGKTTLFNAISGLVDPASGSIRFGRQDVTRLPVEQRAQIGIGRSYQEGRLFANLTVRETLKLAMEKKDPTELVPVLLGLPHAGRQEESKDRATAELAAFLGLEEYADFPTAQLSTGVRRLVEFGCMLATDAEMLLLDEPSAGLAQREVEAFGELLRSIRARTGTTMLIIEHDVPLLVAICDRLYAMDRGRVIAEGDPARVVEDERVLATYLGVDGLLTPTGGEHGRS